MEALALPLESGIENAGGAATPTGANENTASSRNNSAPATISQEARSDLFGPSPIDAEPATRDRTLRELIDMGYVGLSAAPNGTPIAPSSSNSLLPEKLGKVPSLPGRHGAEAIARWQTRKLTDAEIAAADAAGFGNGCVTGPFDNGRHLAVVDVDVLDPDWSELARAIVERHAPGLPLRYGNGAKHSYVMILDGDPGKILPIKFGGWDPEKNRAKAETEFLTGPSKFCMFYGIHRDTGQPYRWERPLLPVAEMTVYPVAVLHAIVADLRASLPDVDPKPARGVESAPTPTPLASTKRRGNKPADQLNDAMMAPESIDLWFPRLFPRATKSGDIWSVDTRNVIRWDDRPDVPADLEERISGNARGLKDWGLADQQSLRADGKKLDSGGRTPLDLYLEFGVEGSTFKNSQSAPILMAAVRTACADIGADPAEFGFVDGPARRDSRAWLELPGRRDAKSEDAVAMDFSARYAERLKYDHDAGFWREFDGAIWRRDNQRRVLNYVREVARENGNGKAGFAAGVEKFAQAAPEHRIDSTILDRDPWLLATPAGTVDLRTGELRAADPEDFITRQTSTGPEEGEPVRFLRFLGEAFSGDAGLIRLTRQWLGYCLTGQTTEHVFVFLHGPGGNGKSLVLNVVRSILADYAVTAPAEVFAQSKYDKHPTELARLRGARLVTSSETEENRAWAEARIKHLTGGEEITARFMRMDDFTFKPEFKIMIAGNHAPALNSVDDAMRRRVIILPFTTKPENPDRLLEEKLRAEHGRILAWMIAGCLDWQANGLVRPAAALAATDRYLASQDTFSQWLDECCTLGATLCAETSALNASWRHFAVKAGEDPRTEKALSAKLQRLGCEKSKPPGLRGARGYSGIGLNAKSLHEM